jgi:hypothetical protein
MSHALRSRTVVWQILACIALTAVGCTHPAGADRIYREPSIDSVLMARTEVAIDSAVPVGEVVGIVVDAYHGTPIGSVLVIAYQKGPPRHVVTDTTDSTGHFHLVGLRSDSAILGTSPMGYRGETRVISGSEGIAARIGLRGQSYFFCGLIVTGKPIPAVTVVIHDARSGSTPLVPVTLRVREGRFVESVTSIAESVDSSLMLHAAPERKGNYIVEVTASGYTPWTARDVRATSNDCHGFTGQTLQVWLLPTSKARRL